MVCPQEGCVEPISYDLIKAHVSQEAFERYERFKLLDMRVPEGDEVLKICPSPNCDQAFFIAHDLMQLTCPGCNFTFCPQCNEEHDETVGCQEFRLRKMDEEAVKMLMEAGVRQCPHCGALSEKVRG